MIVEAPPTCPKCVDLSFRIWKNSYQVECLACGEVWSVNQTSAEQLELPLQFKEPEPESSV